MKQIDEMRTRLDRWNEGFTDNEILSEANGIIQRVPDLLDALEVAQALLNKSADRTAWLIEENERLREMLAQTKLRIAQQCKALARQWEWKGLDGETKTWRCVQCNAINV